MICCHMIADTLPELHAMAELIGLKRDWFQPLSSPHYDVSLERKRLAVLAGARVVERWEFVSVLRRLRPGVPDDPCKDKTNLVDSFGGCRRCSADQGVACRDKGTAP